MYISRIVVTMAMIVWYTGAGEVFTTLDASGRALVDKLSNETSHTVGHR